jgi:hypothetical protein
MADPASEESDDNPEFVKYLEKNLSWLKEKLSLSSEDPPKVKTLDLTSFLQTSLEKAEKAREAAANQLEELRDMLSPEQLIQWKSRKSAGGAGLEKPQGNGSPEPEKKVEILPPPPKKKRFL